MHSRFFGLNSRGTPPATAPFRQDFETQHPITNFVDKWCPLAQVVSIFAEFERARTLSFFTSSRADLPRTSGTDVSVPYPFESHETHSPDTPSLTKERQSRSLIVESETVPRLDPTAGLGSSSPYPVHVLRLSLS